MRIVTTESGKETRLGQADFDKIDRVQRFMRILARECPLIPQYKTARDALDGVTQLFGVRGKVVESFIVKEDDTDGEQPEQPDPADGDIEFGNTTADAAGDAAAVAAAGDG